MKEILIFAGTTEGRKLSECLAEAGIAHTVCVATEYGEIVLGEHPYRTVHQGRMDQKEMQKFLAEHDFAAVVDATHPYAAVVTENIKESMKDTRIPYLRLKREVDEKDCDGRNGQIVTFEDHKSCAKALEQVEGNILLTTGSKELAVYASDEALKHRLYVRILPGMESLSICMEHGIAGKQILALQGPFTTEMNEAMIRQYQIKCLVTKRSGRAGGYKEKTEAAKRAGILTFVIGQEREEEGYSFWEVSKRLEEICEKEIRWNRPFEVILAGVGMGSRENLTEEVRRAIESADVLLGAERMIAGYQARIEKKPLYTADQIIPYLKQMQGKEWMGESRKIVVLFSGDSGFYSGCQKLYQALQTEIDAKRLYASVRILSGISSVAYLAACIGESYQDAAICSIHGKKIRNLTQKIRHEKKLFLLMSGASDVRALGQLLVNAGLEQCIVTAGYHLSYPDQQILTLTPEECTAISKEGLYTCLIQNPEAEEKRLTHGKADAEFIRERVPMTKEEVRDVSICKLKLHQNAVVYDIGSGTGSIAVEIAGLSSSVSVFAIDKKAEAANLIEKNQKKAELENIQIIRAEAPEGLLKLPVPTHAFIGGSGEKLKEILTVLYQKNPHMRIVLNAVSMETICEMKEVLSLFPVREEEVILMQVSRSRHLGNYHLMQAENPVWICSFSFREVMQDEN